MDSFGLGRVLGSRPLACKQGTAQLLSRMQSGEELLNKDVIFGGFCTQNVFS